MAKDNNGKVKMKETMAKNKCGKTKKIETMAKKNDVCAKEDDGNTHKACTPEKNTFIACYNNIILPNNGPKLWPTVDGLPIQPPYVRRAPGRLKKARRKTNDEPTNSRRLKKVDGTVRCKRCFELGHNRRTCKGKTAADRTIPKGGNKSNTCVLQPETQSAPQSAPVTHTETQSAPVTQTAPVTQSDRRQAGTQNATQPGTQSEALGTVSHSGTVSQSAQQKGAKRGRKRKAQSEALGTQQSVNH